MTRLSLGLLTSAAWLAASAPAFAIDPFFPTFGNSGIDVFNYHIALDVNPATNAVSGQTELTITAQRNLNSFKLDLHKLAVSAVTINGAPATFSQTDDKLTITPARPIREGRVFSAKVTYAGVPEPIEDSTAPGAGLLLGWFKYKNSTYALSEPVGASTFYPANDEPNDKATFSFSITVPDGFTGVANGKLVKNTPIGTKRRFDWVMSQPMTSWLATVHVNKLTHTQSTAPNGTPISVYTPEGVPQSHIAAYAEAGPMLDYFESILGRYPFASYGSIVVQDPDLYYALETQAMSTFPAEGSVPDEGLVAHELAHQWFGNSISVARWEDLWIGEGFATYFEVLWPNRNDDAAFEADMQAIYDYVFDNQIGPAVVDAPDQLFSDRTYYRGGAALYALRLKVGEDTINRIFRAFAQERRGGNVDSATFINTAVRVSGDVTVRTLLNAWLYDTAVPELPNRAKRQRGATPAPKPDIVGGRCGRGSHRGAPADCM